MNIQHIDSIWAKVFSFYEKILSSSLLISTPLKDGDDLVNMVTTLSYVSPWRKRGELELLLSNVALDLATMQEQSMSEMLYTVPIYLFRTTYTQLSTLLPYSPRLQSISSMILSKVVDNLNSLHATDATMRRFYIDVGISMCRAIHQMSDASTLAASVYSQICILLNSDSTELRQEASNVLSKIGVAGILHRQEEMQDEMRRLEKFSDEHLMLTQVIEKERIRADTAEAQLRDLMIQMDHLEKENTILKVRNAELQRQVSMLCDGSIL